MRMLHVIRWGADHFAKHFRLLVLLQPSGDSTKMAAKQQTRDASRNNLRTLECVHAAAGNHWECTLNWQLKVQKRGRTRMTSVETPDATSPRNGGCYSSIS
jgi:hypothetical protein